MKKPLLTLFSFLLANQIIQAGSFPAQIAYQVDTLKFEGVWVFPSSKDAPSKKVLLPSIVLVPDWMGITPEAMAAAQRVSDWGYGVFVADIYGKNHRPKSSQEAGVLAGQLKGDVPQLRLRIIAAMTAMKQCRGIDTLKLGAMGFCFGGTTALELARTGVLLKGVISVHGNLNTPFPEDGKHIQGRVLILHGSEDPFVPPEQIENFMDEMRAAGTDWQMNYYGGAVHAFTNPKAGSDPKKGVAFNPKADERAFKAIKDFWSETLK